MTKNRTRITASKHLLWILLLAGLVPLAYLAWCLSRVPTQATMTGGLEGDWIVTGNQGFDDREPWVETRLLNIQNGREIRTPGYDIGGTTANAINSVEPNANNRLQIKRIQVDSQQEQILAILDLSEYQLPVRCNTEGFIATFDKKFRLCVLDSQGGISSKPVKLPDLPWTDTHFWMPVWINPNRLAVYEIANKNPVGKDRCLLFRFEAGELSLLSEWTAQYLPRSSRQQIASISPLQVIEFRDLSNGELTSSMKLRDIIPATTATGYYLEGVNEKTVVVSDSSNWYLIDHHSGQLVQQGTAIRTYSHAAGRFAVGNKLGEHTQYTIYDEQTGNEVGQIALPDSRHLQLSDTGEQLVVLNNDESVHVYEIASGNLLRIWRSRWWFWPSVTVLAVGCLVWAIGLTKANRRLGLHPIFLVVFWNLVLFSGLVIRLLSFGSFRDSHRPIYLYFHAQAASWLVLISLWFVFGRTRLALRLVGLIVAIAAIALLSLVILQAKQNRLGDVLLDMLGGGCLLIMLFQLTKWFGWRPFQPDLENSSIVETSKWQLRDFFIITAAMSLLFAAARLVQNWPSLATSTVLTMSCIIFAAALSAVITTWAVISPKAKLLKMLVATTCVGLLAFVPYLFFNKTSNWFWHLREIISISLFTAFSVWLLSAEPRECHRKLQQLKQNNDNSNVFSSEQP